MTDGWRRGFVVLTAAAVLFSACSSDSVSTGGDGEADVRPVIRLVTYSSFVINVEVLDAVEQRLGADIEIVARDDAGAALSQAILTAGRPEGDLFFGVDNTLMGRALAADLFEPLGDVDLSDTDPDLRLDDTGMLAPIQYGDVCVNYDIDALAEAGVRPPTEFADLVDPTYRSMLVIENPALSSPGLVFLAATHEAMGDEAANWWSSLKTNDVEVAGSWDDAWNVSYTVNGGERPLVVSYASSPPAEVFYSEGTLDAPRSGVAAGTCARQVEFAGVLRGAEHPDLARELIGEMLSEQWQVSLPLSNFVLPARVGVDPPADFSDHFVAPSKPVALDPTVVASDSDAWIDEWRTLIE